MHITRRPRTIAACGVATLLAGTAAVTATATHGGLHGLFNARGTIGELKLHDTDQRVKIVAKDPIDVAIVAAQLDGHGQTGWHTHPADSIVTVRPGSPNLRMTELVDGGCVTTDHRAGEAFVHPAHAHNFVNTGATALDFGVAYFVPVGAALLTPTSPPPDC